ncbi:hypothetical protein SFRURICE_016104 [Spodoptera frugiperda]|nr:hypothetical protein SFRURICE_016104 [Spodoptera frugiperda]
MWLRRHGHTDRRCALCTSLVDFFVDSLSEGLVDFSEGLVDFSEGLVDFSEGLVDFSEGLVDFSEGLVDFSEFNLEFLKFEKSRGFDVLAAVDSFQLIRWKS